MRLLFISLISLLLLYVPNKANAGSLNYTVYGIQKHAGQGLESFCFNNGSYLSTCNNTNPAYVVTTYGSGTIDNLNNNWDGGNITIGGTSYGSSYRYIKITGYWQHPGTAGQTSTVYFAGRNDDGLIVNINNTAVISDWAQQGPTYWNSNGSFTGVGGQWYPINIDWYEWTGYANLDLHYRIDGNNATNTTVGWLDMPNSGFSTTDQNQVDISITSGQTTIMNNVKSATGSGVNITTNGDGITLNIQQAGEDNFIIGTDLSSAATITGNNNSLTVNQGNITTSGNSGHNGLAIDITGATNNVNISQGDYSADSGDHRIWLDIDGSTNTLNLSQRNDGAATSEHFMYLDIDSDQNTINAQQLNDGDKILFLDINNNNNTVDINQSDDGSHYLDVLLDTGNSAHDVDISQTGTGNHAARVDLDGYSIDFDLTQSGNTSQDYSVTSTCGANAGCSISTTQN